MIHKDDLLKERQLLFELIEGCLEEEGYKVDVEELPYSRYLFCKTPSGKELKIRIRITG